MLCKEYQTKNANQLIFKRLAFYHVLEAGLSSIKYHKINLIVIQMIISYLYF